MVRTLWLTGGKGPGVLLAIILLVLSSVLAGCTGDALDPEEENHDGTGTGSGPVPDDTEDLQQTPYRFTDETINNITIEEQGTFGPADHCYLFGCIVLDNMYRYDVSEDIPVGVPTLVTAEFRLDASISFYNLSMEIQDGETYWTHWKNDSGLLHVQALVIRHDPAGTVEIVVSPQLGSDDDAQTDWELRVTLEPRPDRIPPGALAWIPVDETTTRLNLTATDGDAEYLLWDGEDRFLGHNKTSNGQTHYPIPANATRGGGFVIYTTPDSAPLRIDALGTGSSPGNLESLFYTWVPVGEAQTVDAMENTTWTFDVDTVPLAVGIGIEYEDLVDNGNIWFQVASPAEAVLEAQSGCFICVGYSYRVNSDHGDRAHIPGTYTVTAETNISTGIDVQTYLVTYER